MPNDNLDAKLANLKIRRVCNGWVIHSDNDQWGRSHDGMYVQGETVVARTPGELSEQVMHWAQKQADGLGGS
jgi:hypothetical protein